MKTNYFFILLFVFLTFFSCKSDKKTSETVENRIPVIDIGKAVDNLSNQKFNFSEFTDDITYLPLETNDKSVIGGRFAPPISVSENLIFHGDMMFGRDGRFIRKLGKIGQGPEEYVQALGIAVDEERKEFYVHSNLQIYIYDFESRFKKKFMVSDRGHSIYSIGNGKIVLFRDNWGDYFNFNEYRVFDINSEKLLYTRYSGVKDYDTFKRVRNLLWRYNEETFYYEASTDSIFRLKENGEIDVPRYIINHGKYKNKNSEYYLNIGFIVESGQYLFFSISKRSTTSNNSDLYYCAFDKQTEKIIINKFDEFFNNDIDGGFVSLFNSTSNGHEGFYYIFPFLAKERIETFSNQNKGYDKEKNQKLRQLIKDIKEDDNKIFYFFKLK